MSKNIFCVYIKLMILLQQASGAVGVASGGEGVAEDGGGGDHGRLGGRKGNAMMPLGPCCRVIIGWR